SASWSAAYPDSVSSITGSCAVLPCTFAFPGDVSVANGIVAIWYKHENEQLVTVLHSTSPEKADARFQNRVQLLGDSLERNCTLLLRELTKEDSGPYSFRFEIVKANSWTEKKQLQLTITDAPKGVQVILRPPNQNIRVGDAVSLVCNVSASYPEPSAFRWFKDGSACGTEQVKNIQPVSLKDYGLYNCEAENALGTGVAEGVPLLIFSAVLSVSPSSRVREGEMVSLTCEVPGGDQQEILYSWYKNTLWLKEGSARILTFQQVTVGDTGYYACKVQNDKGSQTSAAVSLTVLYPPRPPSLALFQERQRGQLAIVHCTVDSNPQATLSLFRDGRLLATTSSHSAPSQRIRIAATRNSLKMEIQRVTLEDEGEYQCLASNQYGNASSSSFFRSQTARVVASPSDQLVEGQRVALTCLTTVGSEEEEEEDPTTYVWYKNAKWLQQGQKDTLVLSAVVSGDAGSFHCVAENKKGSHISPPIALRVLYSPRLPVMTSFLETQGGHLGIIQCTVDSDPPSEIALYKGNTLVGSTDLLQLVTDPRIQVTSSHNTLKVTIQVLRWDDEGEYVCSAQNRYGDAMSTMEFTTETASITISPSPEVHEGHAVRLSCTLSGNLSASANYSWFKGGLHLPGASGDSLVLEHVALEDAGAYKCRVDYHGVSKTSSSASLSVLYAPRNLHVSVFTETERGTVAIFQCSVDSHPPATWVLYKGDAVLATSGEKDEPASRRVSVTTGPGTLHVEMTGVVPEDEGSYNVTATNAHGSASRRLYFRVQTARILITPSPEVVEGDQVSLTCDVMGSLPEEASFSWYRNSKHLQGEAEGTLAFLPVTRLDAGAYYCKAQTAQESSLSISPSVSLTVFYPPGSPQITAFLETQDNRVAVLLCTVESDPQAHLAIRKGQQLLASSTDSALAHPRRVKASPTYNSLRVEIWDVVMEDEGEYVCFASNRHGNGSARVTFRAEAAKLWISPPDALEGNSVNLTCAVDSEAAGEMRYTWFKNNEWYADGLVRTLVFHQATVEDAGSYYCTVHTRERMRNSSLSTLNVLYPPRNVLVESFLETQKGQVAIVLCTVQSNPPSALSLRRAGQLLASSSSKVRGGPGPKLRAASSPNSLRLEIKDVNLDDEGSYECWAGNSLGEAHASFNLSVETIRLVIDPAPEVHEGQRVSLICQDASFQPSAIYTWYKDARWFADGPATSFLLPAVTPRDMGSYVCQVQDERGVRTSPAVTLYVHYEPKKVTLTSFLETPSGNQAVLQCVVESYPPSELTLYRGNGLVASSRISGNLPGQRYVVQASHNFLKVEIQKVLREDEGQYHCTAKNIYGTSAASIHFGVPGSVDVLINVDAPERPSLTVYLDTQNGNLAMVTCKVDSYPSSSLAIYRGQLADPKSWSPASQRFHTFYSDNSLRLEIQDLTAKDSGHFVCQARNTLGNATSSITFNARSPAQHLLRCQREPRVSSSSFPAGLSELTIFKIWAGIATALICIAALGGLILGLRNNSSRIYQKWVTWTKEKRSKEEVQQAENREDVIQLNAENPETPPAGRSCFSYRRLPWKADAAPKEAAPESNRTSSL
ncbi:sialoadhesin-like, partial [Protobothrops mucrosquamatus]|uniref:sialoadhesin-like n=1 Tax=Protobothrops mucrosquamatus TaxID=103944 RepID=UPI0010FB2E0D